MRWVVRVRPMRASETPRTDAFAQDQFAMLDGETFADALAKEWADFARQLERELSAACETLGAMTERSLQGYVQHPAQSQAVQFAAANIRVDAQRYNWLRARAKRSLLRSKKRGGDIQVIRWSGREEADVLWLEALDAAIDAALAEEGR